MEGTSTLTERYRQERPALESALSVWRADLEELAEKVDRNSFVDGRVKSHRSVIGKVYRAPGVVRPWESLGDLVALKAVFPTMRGVEEFTASLCARDAWNPDLDDRKTAPDRLGYAAKQIDLWRADVIDTRGEPVKIEVQVRTAAADAWYVVDHRLRYKGIVELPDELQRKLLRLTVFAELFDQEVESIVEAQASLGEYAVARAYELSMNLIDELTDGLAKASRPEALFETLLTSYDSDELVRLEQIVGDFVTSNRTVLSHVIRRHRYDAEAFVEERDRLYSEPEAVLIAERALQRPAMLRGALMGSNYEGLVTPMIAAFEGAARDGNTGDT
ncbi:hypothetical protein Q6346_15275 [Isoptericola sp. b490]|uniref:hypothetical protein n=1 Tax=Actinotalea lenta TaxID=3064654 RepID=UPI002713C372|nr:hypothetical protein [Isoptericola sp. b490]MDO8122669.1 hypothetical protein [Isoptericola sp. b490]